MRRRTSPNSACLSTLALTIGVERDEPHQSAAGSRLRSKRASRLCCERRCRSPRSRDAARCQADPPLSGYSGEHPQQRIEAIAVAPYPIAGDIQLAGVCCPMRHMPSRNIERARNRLAQGLVRARGRRGRQRDRNTFACAPMPVLRRPDDHPLGGRRSLFPRRPLAGRAVRP